MVRTVYADLLFLINFSMDFLCFFLCFRLLGKNFLIIRTLLASAIGGVYAVCSLFLPFRGLPLIFCDFLACVLMCLVVFLRKGTRGHDLLPATFLYTGVSMALGGIMTALYTLFNETALLDMLKGEEEGVSSYLFLILAAVGGGASLIGTGVVHRRVTDQTVRIGFSICGRSVETDAIIDTGNRLVDPITGHPAIGVAPELLSGLLPFPIERFTGEAITQLEGLPEEFRSRARLLPVSTATGKGLLVAFRPDDIWVGNPENKKNYLIALFPVELSGAKAILPPDAVYQSKK